MEKKAADGNLVTEAGGLPLHHYVFYLSAFMHSFSLLRHGTGVCCTVLNWAWPL
jgi:hypothetical protein